MESKGSSKSIKFGENSRTLSRRPPRTPNWRQGSPKWRPKGAKWRETGAPSESKSINNSMKNESRRRAQLVSERSERASGAIDVTGTRVTFGDGFHLIFNGFPMEFRFIFKRFSMDVQCIHDGCPNPPPTK